MGLDMYLYKRHYVGNKWREASKQVRIAVPKNQQGVTFPTQSINNERITEISEEVAYWRKANQIHRWFVDNVQRGADDCKDYYVPREKLTELLNTCRKVIKASKLAKGKIKNGYTYKNGQEVPIMEEGEYIGDPSVAKELLPTQEGFFFGSYDYDQYYLDDVKFTANALEKLLKEKDGDYYYQSSW